VTSCGVPSPELYVPLARRSAAKVKVLRTAVGKIVRIAAPVDGSAREGETVAGSPPGPTVTIVDLAAS
jgi:hypothetical protein